VNITGKIGGRLTVGVVAKKYTPEILRITSKIYNLLEDRVEKLLVEERLASLLNISNGVSLREIYADVDTLIIVGGDGSFLRTVFEMPYSSNKKFLGVKVATSLGFLMSSDELHLEDDLKSFIQGNYWLEKRSRLELFIPSTEKKLYFLNEIVVRSGDFQSLVSLEVVDLETGEKIYKGKCDGLILSTTTGASAYAFSLNRVVVDYRLDVLYVLPIAPLSVLSLPIVMPSKSRLKVKIKSAPGGVSVVGDGFHTILLKQGEIGSLYVGRGDEINLVRFRSDFYRRIRERVLYGWQS